MASMTRDQLTAALSCITPDTSEDGTVAGQVKIHVLSFTVPVTDVASAMAAIENIVPDLIAGGHVLPVDITLELFDPDGDNLPLQFDGTIF